MFWYEKSKCGAARLRRKLSAVGFQRSASDLRQIRRLGIVDVLQRAGSSGGSTAERCRLIADRKLDNLRAPRRFSGLVAPAFLPVWPCGPSQKLRWVNESYPWRSSVVPAVDLDGRVRAYPDLRAGHDDVRQGKLALSLPRGRPRAMCVPT